MSELPEISESALSTMPLAGEEDSIKNRIRSNDPLLGKLYLTQFPMEYFDDGPNVQDDQDFEDFLRALQNNTHIYYVLLNHRFVRGLSSAKYAQVLRAIATIPNLVELEVFGVRLPLPTLCHALQNAKKLFRLCLGMVTLTQANQDCRALQHHPSLQYVCLSDFRFLVEEEHKNLDSLWEALSTCPSLSSLEIFSNQFDTNPWTAAGLAHLASCPRLNQLTLRRLRLTCADILPFAHQLETRGAHSNLKILNLHKNRLGGGGCVAIARAVRASGILELDLRANQLFAEASQSVIPLLTSPTSRLEKLNLSSNEIGDTGAELFAQALERDSPGSLKHLDLARASMTDTGCSRLARSLTVNKTLISLGLSHNDMTNATYLAFGEALRTQNRTLVSLHLQCDRTKIEMSGCAALLSMVEENYVLETVSALLSERRGYDRHGQKSKYAYYIRIYLRLNHAGRRKLLEQRGSKQDWINAMAAVQDSLHAIYYLIKTNPSLCHQN